MSSTIHGRVSASAFSVDGNDIRTLDNMATPLAAGAKIYIAPSVAGGR